MSEEIQYPQTVSDTPFPGEAVTSTTSDQPSGAGVSAPTTTKGNSFPIKKVAVELLSTALNTRSRKVLGEFTLEDKGAFRVGKYVNGVSGEVAMTPSGITAKSTSGNTTFAIDGETGNATFGGELQSGSVITGLIVVGNNRLVLDGEAGRITVNDGVNNIIAIGNLDF